MSQYTPEQVESSAELFTMDHEVRDMLRAFAATLRQQAGMVDAGCAQDLRHLIYLDTQFGMRGETDLKLPEMQALEARGWIAEGEESGEYVVTDAGERIIAVALAQNTPYGPGFGDCSVCFGTGEVGDADGNGQLCDVCEGSGNTAHRNTERARVPDALIRKALTIASNMRTADWLEAGGTVREQDQLADYLAAAPSQPNAGEVG